MTDAELAAIEAKLEHPCAHLDRHVTLALCAEVRRLREELAASRAATDALLEQARDRDLRNERGFD